MKTTNKIILSTITTLILLLNGCGGGGTETGGGDVGAGNPVPPIAVTPDPVIPEPTEPKPPVSPYKPAGWYGKTVVSATDSNGKVYSHSTAGVFGQLVQSDDLKDKHDIPAMGSSIIRVIFPQADWAEEDNGAYFSDYRKYDPEYVEKQVWTFQVKNQEVTDLSDANISIALQGVYDVEYKEENGNVTYKESTDINQTILNELHLVDVDKGEEYTLAELENANLDMNGSHTRTFRWVRGIVEEDDFTPLAKTSAVQTKSFSSDAEADSFKTETGGKFGLPPQ